jgi:ATP-dependent Clp protease ATP-binding subunit ClpA
MAKNAVGFLREGREGEDADAINRMFSPEFRNRLDAVIPFGNLPMEVVEKVVDKFVIELEAQLGERDVTIDLHPDARRWLAEKGYDKHMGARPLGRVIQENIKKPLAEELLFGRLVNGGTVEVRIEEGKPVFDIHSRPGKSRTEREPEMA